MAESKRTELAVQSERALLVSVMMPNSNHDPMDPVGELRALARTAGAQVVDEMAVKRRSIHPGMYIGTGKAEEIAQRAQMNQADVVIFDNDLSPGQIRDLEEVILRKVLDRSELILDIFAAHARTAESRLQVELAQLEYTYPRLMHMWSHLERLAGGASTAASAVGGIGTRGPGEKQLEIDRRLVQKRVSMLKQRIAEVDGRKVRQVRSRKDTFGICIVGYTNAGKSTLMNRLTGADVFVADQLFATLDTRTRRWPIGDGPNVLLSDTVGFVRDLPHHLVASFKATLEEAIHADLLLHVADASHDRVVHQIDAARKVLKEIGCDESRELMVMNKIDRITDPTVRLVLANRYPRSIFLSAITGDGVDELNAEVARRAGGSPIRVTLRADCRDGRLMQYLAQHARVESQKYDDHSVVMDALMPEACVQELQQFGSTVEMLQPTP